MNRYESAKELYAGLGVDTDEALRKLGQVKISMHCWQGDDVGGFENSGDLSGGIAGHRQLSRQGPELRGADLGHRHGL